MEAKEITIHKKAFLTYQQWSQWKNDNHCQTISPDFDCVIQSGDNPENSTSYLLKSTENQIQGILQLDRSNQDNRCLRLEFELDLEHSYIEMKRVLTRLITQLFEEDIHRIEIETPLLKPIHHQFLTEIGFRHEGIRQQAFYNKGSYEDIHLYGQIKKEPSRQLQDYLDYALPHYHNPESLYSIINHLGFFNPEQLNTSKLYFLATFCGLLEKLQTNSKFIHETLIKLNDLNWSAKEINEALHSLARQLSTPLTEEEKIIHDLYYIEQISASTLMQVISTEGLNSSLIHKIIEGDFQFFTSVGKQMGLERLEYTQKIIAQL